MKRFFRNENFPGILLAAVIFPIYLLTLSSSLTTEDPGELATTLYTLGIAHPTGYPLFTLLGWVFSHLPIGGTVIWKLNLFGAVLTTLATFLFYRAMLFLLIDPTNLFQTPRSRKVSEVRDRTAAVVGTFILAFSGIYWSEAVGLEVYALHLVFLALVTRLFLGALADSSRKPWTLFAFVLGLSFTNHLMTVLLAPAFLFLFFRVHGFGRKAWTRILTAIPFFLTPLALYLYLPLRAAQHPLMNWGEPSSLERFWRHITAAQYGDKMFSSWDIAGRKLLQFFGDMPGNFGYAPLLLAALGLGFLCRTPRLLLFTGLVFGTGLLYAINYAFDDPNFNLNAHFMVAVWAAFGARALLAVSSRWKWTAGIACAGIALCPLAFNYRLLDKSRDSAVEDYARNVLASMDTGAVFFTNEYERLGSPAFYLQMIEGYRNDIAVLDIILLGNPWFYPQLEARYPWLIRNSRAEIQAHRDQVDKYLWGKQDEVAHNASIKKMVFSIIENSRAAGRSVYVSSGINLDSLPGYRFVPSGMVYQLVRDEDTLFIPPRDFSYKPLPSRRANPLSEQIQVEYAEGYANQGQHLLDHGDTVRAVERFHKALEVYPGFQEVNGILKGLRALP